MVPSFVIVTTRSAVDRLHSGTESALRESTKTQRRQVNQGISCPVLSVRSRRCRAVYSSTIKRTLSGATKSASRYIDNGPITCERGYMGHKARPEKFHTVIAQNWEESERGWGVRPDGFTLHLTMDNHDAYVEAYLGRQKAYFNKELGVGITPSEYTRLSGRAVEITVNDQIFQKLTEHADKNGLWGVGRSSPRDLARPECAVRVPTSE